jgi:hypothetical protein
MGDILELSFLDGLCTLDYSVVYLTMLRVFPLIVLSAPLDLTLLPILRICVN